MYKRKDVCKIRFILVFKSYRILFVSGLVGCFSCVGYFVIIFTMCAGSISTIVVVVR